MCELFYDLILGVFSGVISSAIVSLVIMYHQNKRQFSTDFFNDKQACARYFDAIKLELLLCDSRNDFSDLSSIVRVFEDSPVRRSFSYLEDCDAKKWSEIFAYLRDLEEQIKSNKITCHVQYAKISGELLKCSLAVLRFHCRKLTVCEVISYSR